MIPSCTKANLSVGDVSNVEKNEIYNNMKVSGTGVSGEVIEDSPLYFTRNQEIVLDEDYIIFYDMKTQYTVPVKEKLVDELWGEYLFKVE